MKGRFKLEARRAEEGAPTASQRDPAHHAHRLQLVNGFAVGLTLFGCDLFG